MTARAFRYGVVRLTLAVCVVVALPGSASARTNCNEAPGLRYPLIDWRAVGPLPQTHRYPMTEDTIEMTIADGAAQNVPANEMVIVLEQGFAGEWRKEIAAINAWGQTISTVTVDSWQQPGPSRMRIQQAPSCFGPDGARTIVFRKFARVGRMWDMYHFDIDHFWTTLGGKIVTFKWVNDNTGDPQYPPHYRSPRTIPFDRNLAAASWNGSFNRFDLFQNRDGTVQHSWLNGFWRDENLGVPPANFGFGQIVSSGPAASSAAYNNLDVFLRDGCNRTRQLHWNGAEWVWHGYPLTCVSSEELTSSLAAVSWGLNRIDLATRGTDFAFYHKFWDGSQWSAWERLGGWFTSSPAIVSTGINRLTVFGRGGDNAVWINSWNGSSWSGWSSLYGNLTSDPAAVVYGPDRVAVFARGADDALWVTVKHGANAPWQNWGSLGGILTSNPAVTSSRPDQIDVFVKNTNGGISRRTWQSPSPGMAASSNSSGWSAWAHVGLPICGGWGC